MSAKDPDNWRQQLETRTRSPAASWVESADVWVPGLVILCHPDVRRIGERAPLPELVGGGERGLSRLEPAFLAADGDEPRPLADPRLSRRPIRLTGAADRAVRLDCDASTIRVVADGAPVSSSRTFSREDLERGVLLVLAGSVTLLLYKAVPAPIRLPPRFGLEGESSGIVRARRDVERVADLMVPVLICGETGTGKELVARAIHDHGPRRDAPWVVVNMGAVPPSLAAAELFGSAKGAFTGADRRRPGYFHRARGGTLFLDEIGEAPAEVQIMLLRVLETGEVQSLGAEEPGQTDARVIAATDADLEAAVAAGGFRGSLLHRLSAYEISLPPLRRRREDFGNLLRHFLRCELTAIGDARRLDEPPAGEEPWLPAELVARLAACRWPGNIRQLHNVVRQVVISSRGRPRLELGRRTQHLLESAGALGCAAGTAKPRAQAPKKAYRHPGEVSETELVAALRRHRWELKPAAADLGVSRTSLYTLIDRCAGARKAADLGRAEIAASFERCGGRLEAMVDELEVSKNGLRLKLKQLGLS